MCMKTFTKYYRNQHRRELITHHTYTKKYRKRMLFFLFLQAFIYCLARSVKTDTGLSVKGYKDVFVLGELQNSLRSGVGNSKILRRG